ncbi:SARP family transcriptional regulator [Saccharothrix coeruleofusca]|uniref:SARP family transcriptional regulator n=1 Tax=Saccharothrix coeruleofusca TaxID=33919 RepID=A0A918AUC0_9PSEU|nr:SARP family transcriptional regulator [Saccharothrix coeruleofusca]
MEFKVLGPLEVLGEEGRVNPGGRKQQHVLATLLLASGNMVPVDRLVEAVWAGRPPTTAAHQVRKTVADLRRRLGDELIVTDGPGYRLVLCEEQLDLNLFNLRMARAAEAIASSLASNAAAQLDLGLRLWRDSALCGLGGPVLGPAIVQLNERRLVACEQLNELRLALGEAASVLTELRAMVEQYPLRETLHRQLMIALYRTGRQAEALRAFADARALLADELGVDPGPQLQRLHEQILRGDLDTGLEPVERAISVVNTTAEHAPTPNTLPYNLPDFTGRAAELTDIVASVPPVEDRALTIIAIDGMVGVGKTSLALHAAHTIGNAFPDGQLFVDLRGHVEGIEPINPTEALEQLLQAIGVSGEQIPSDLAARSAMWRVRTAGKRMLIVLDDATGIEQIRPLLPGAASCLLLITSRARITDLDGVHALTLSPMSKEDSVMLVSRIIGDRKVEESGSAVTELVKACGHLPLALRIAATRLQTRPTWTVKDLVNRLRNEDQRLDGLTLGNRSVSSAIELSYRRLPTEHRRLFRCVALTLGNDFDTRVAAAMTAASVPRTERLLEDLLDAQLLIQPRPKRYAMHGLLREYAQQALRAEESEAERAAIFQRLLDYYLYTAEAAASRIHPGRRRLALDVPPPTTGSPEFDSQAAALTWFDQEQDGLFAAVSHVAEQGPDHHGSHLPRAMASYLQIRGRLHNHIGMLRKALKSAARTGDQALKAMNLGALSSVQWQLGQCTEAFDNMWRALSIAENSGDRECEGECLNRIGLLSEAVGRYEAARSFLQRALSIHRQTGNLFEEGLALNSICSVHLAMGRFQLAGEAARSALLLHRRLGHRAYVVSALHSVATAELRLHHHTEALAVLDTAAETAQRIGYRSGEAIVLTRRADTHLAMGMLDEAYRCGIRALELVWTVQVPALEAEATNTLAAVSFALGDLTTAMARHRNALDIARRVQRRIEVARAMEGIGLVSAALGEHEEAARQWRSALHHHMAMGTPDVFRLRSRITAVAGREGA